MNKNRALHQVVSIYHLIFFQQLIDLDTTYPHLHKKSVFIKPSFIVCTETAHTDFCNKQIQAETRVSKNNRCPLETTFWMKCASTQNFQVNSTCHAGNTEAERRVQPRCVFFMAISLMWKCIITKSQLTIKHYNH